MKQVIGQVLPIALGIAISPIPISAVVLLMLGKRPLQNGLSFLVGWIVGVGLPASLVAIAVNQMVRVTPAPNHPAVLGTLLVVLGLLCWFFAWRVFRSRPAPGQKASEPRWMRTLTDAGPIKSLALGLALSGLNPEDLMLALSGGAVIGSAALSAGQTTIALLVFTGIGSLTVLGPPVVFAIGRDRSAATLASSKEWLVQHNAVLMAALLFLIGGAVLGHGIQAY